MVTPFMGVWIEIIWSIILSTILLSLPLWECGLKYLQWPEPYFHHPVTPFMGVWIEMKPLQRKAESLECHSLYGSVD